MSSQSLSARTLRGVQWATLSTLITAVLQVGYTAVMARLLSPQAFGLVAMAGVVLRFGSYFAEMGLGHALVQRPELQPTDIRATFTASLLLSATFTALAWLLAPLAVFFLANDAVIPLVRGMALGFFFTGLGMTATSLLRRELRFKSLAIIEVVSYVLGYGGVGISMALSGGGVWSLVAAGLAQQLLLSLLTYSVVRHPIRPVLTWAPYAPLLGYGSRVSFITFLEFLSGNLDTLLIGRLLGPGALGIYSRAYQLLYLPTYYLTHSLARVVFPALSQIQAQLARLRQVYLSSTTLVAWLVLPLCAGMAVAAPELVKTMLGTRWGAAVPVLQLLCLAIPLTMTTMFAGIVCDACAYLQRKLVLNLQYLTVLAALLYGLHGYGLLGIAAAIVLGETVRTLMYMRLMHLDLDLPYRELLRMYGPGLRLALLVGGSIALASAPLRAAQAPLLATLLLQMLVGAVVLAAGTLRWPPAPMHPTLHSLLARLLVLPPLGKGWLRYLVLRYGTYLRQLPLRQPSAPTFEPTPA
jgi:O-antigen/teichoic acid export membrane protein